MTDRDDYVQKQALEGEGFELRRPAVRLHGSKETETHLVLKALLARKLQRAGREWDTEVRTPDGRVDVLDVGPADGKSTIYEIETNATPQRIRKKADQYASAAVRDVIVIDADLAPDELEAMSEWLDQHLIGLEETTA